MGRPSASCSSCAAGMRGVVRTPSAIRRPPVRFPLPILGARGDGGPIPAEFARRGARAPRPGVRRGPTSARPGSTTRSTQRELALLQGVGLGADTTLLDLGAGRDARLAAAPRCAAWSRSTPRPRCSMRSRGAPRSAARLTNVDLRERRVLEYVHRGGPAGVVTAPRAQTCPTSGRRSRAARALVAGSGRDPRSPRQASPARSSRRRSSSARASDCVARAEDGWTRAELETHLRDEHGTFERLLEPMLDRAGFRIERADYGERRASPIRVPRAVDRVSVDFSSDVPCASSFASSRRA